MSIERLIDQAIRIQQIAAPTFAESQRAAYLLEAFGDRGLVDVECDPVGNILGRIPGGAEPPLIVSAHLDTVFPLDTDLSITRLDNRIQGPGIGDNALSLSALLELATEIGDPAGDIWLVANVGEEGLGNLCGMWQIVERFGSAISAYIVVEGMGLGNIYHQALPIQRLRISATTQGGHAWIHAPRRSAVHALLGLGKALADLPLPAAPHTILNIGILKGGTSINTIAASAAMQLDLRSESASTLHQLVEQVKELTASHRSANLEWTIDQIGERPGGGIPQSHPLVQAAEQAYRQHGIDLVHFECGSTDASAPLSRDLPAVCVGLTIGGGAHTLEEYIEVAPLEAGFRALVALIKSAHSLA